MRATIIPPIGLIRRYSNFNGGYHLTLTSLLQEHSDYKEFVKLLCTMGHFVILDNDAYETGESSPAGALWKMAQEIRPAEIVLPDVLDSGVETFSRSKEALALFRRKPFDCSVQYMGVPHGSDIDEWLDCAAALLDLGVDSIGVARMYGMEPGSWAGTVQALNRLVLNKYAYKAPLQVHLLGWPDRIVSLKEVATLPFMKGLYLRGVDSSKPFVYASQGLLIGETASYKGRSNDFFTKTEFDDALVLRNIHIFRAYANATSM